MVVLLPLYDNTAALCGFPIKTCWRIFTLLYVHNFYFSPIRYDRGATLLRKEKKKKATDLWLKRRTSHPEKKTKKNEAKPTKREAKRPYGVNRPRSSTALSWLADSDVPNLFIFASPLPPSLPPPRKKQDFCLFYFLTDKKKPRPQN